MCNNGFVNCLPGIYIKLSPRTKKAFIGKVDKHTHDCIEMILCRQEKYTFLITVAKIMPEAVSAHASTMVVSKEE